MLFPRPEPSSSGQSQTGEHDILLKDGHLRVGHGVARKAFQGELQANLAFDEGKRAFVIGALNPMSIRMRYPKPFPIILKQKNAQGEVSVAVQEWLMDHDLPDHPRSLKYEWEERVQLLTVYL